DTLEKNPYSQSLYYEEQQFLAILGWVYIALGMLSIALLIYALIRRRDKRDFDRRLASWSGSVCLEIKIVLSLLPLMVGLRVGSTSWSDLSRMVLATTFTSIEILLFLWWFYVLLVDLIVNRRTFFSHNFINSLLKWYQKYESQYSWQQSMLKRAHMLVVAEAVLALLSFFFLLIAISSSNSGLLLIALLFAGAGIYLICRYLRLYKQTISDLGKLIDHIELIKSGNMESRLELAADADMYPAAQNLNALQEGMSINISEKMKSEHLKIELVTNVSHDLKTPLTSIISYVDLLAKEKDLPTHVNDYVKILVQKSERLKNLIQDLFDLSKASSGSIALDMEQLDLARLIKQTLADMEEPISASGLAFRLSIPDEPVYILADGKKLYRVWENLIANALKYSLPGSRVFVDLTVDDKSVLATIKNTANEEMNFGEDEILQRFVRGDSTRTTEGSGLGLSIAQQFTQICGGNFSIKIDGDLFKVELLFALV
ncbi:MAG: HAMP domain-containing sensor histidine kinase, partial [Syntrophomonas sp.]|nr:HAMP domain-containing sensor histidine kinase [Syntrophomonas sp.]